MKDKTQELIEAAEAYASTYDDDARECIKTDVLNAFYNGAAYGEQVAKQRIEEFERRLAELIASNPGSK